MQIKRFVFNPFSENTYIVWDEKKEAAIVDPGAWLSKEKLELKSFTDENQLQVKHLLSTHLHLDHAFGIPFVYETYGVGPQYNEAEETLPDIYNQARFFGMNAENTTVPAERLLNDGDVILFGETSLRTILIPGHSPGSICFYCESEDFLFSGDVIFRGSIGRTDLWEGGNHQQLINGIREKILTLPDETAIYPGHGPVTTVRYEKQSNPYLKD